MLPLAAETRKVLELAYYCVKLMSNFILMVRKQLKQAFQKILSLKSNIHDFCV